MACFLVSAAEAVVATVAVKALEKKEKNGGKHSGIPFSRKLGWLRNMLWGGSALLAFEHVWHGEVTPWFPFLTAMDNPADKAEMFGEMATVGVSMACLVTCVWLVMLAVSAAIEKRTDSKAEAEG
ncbi:MAG: hypothetical protein IJT95_00730 [Abditibacteriota bacterium]|nr:hypothetical protein [Abditibacteriota bacterium]